MRYRRKRLSNLHFEGLVMLNYCQFLRSNINFEEIFLYFVHRVAVQNFYII